MSIIALDLDRDSARVAVAEPRAGGDARLVHAALIEATGDTAELATRLRAALPNVRWARAKLVMAAGGDQVSLRLLKLPPTPDAELADMVHLLAEKEFGGGDGGAVDFYPLTGGADSPRTVLAVRVKQSTLDAFRKLAEQLDATPARMVVRACGAASVAARLDKSICEGACLVAAPAGDAVDLIALSDGAPAVVRTARGKVAADNTEVKRTLSTASLQVGQPVTKVTVLGAGGAPLSGLAVSEWGLAEDEAEAADAMPGAIGAALDEAEKRTPEFDLLNPRHAETDNAPRRRQLILAGVAVLAVLLGIGQAYLSLWRLDAERERLEEDRRLVQQSIDKFQPYANRAAAIDQWLATDMNWLDELEQLGRDLRPQPLDAKEFPADRDVMLTMFTANASGGKSGAGGQIVLDAIARDSETSTQLEQRLRDGRRQLDQGSLDQSGERPYVWRFKPTVKITTTPAAAAENNDARSEAPQEKSSEGKPADEEESKEGAP